MLKISLSPKKGDKKITLSAKSTSVLFEPSGFSFVEVLILGTVSLFIGLAISQMLIAQHRQLDRMSKTMAVMDYQILAREYLRTGCTRGASFYNWTFVDTTPNPIADVVLAPNEFIPINNTILATSTNNQDKLFASGLQISPRYNDLIIDTVRFRNLRTQNIPNRYRGDLEVSFRPYANGQRQFPLIIPVLVTTASPNPPTQRIIGCSPATFGGTGTLTQPRSRIWNVTNTPLNTWVTFTVPDNAKMFTLTMTGGGGGGGVGSWTGGARTNCQEGEYGQAFSGGGGGSGAALIRQSITMRAGETVGIFIGSGGVGGCTVSDGSPTQLLTQNGAYITPGGRAGRSCPDCNGGAGGACPPGLNGCVPGMNGANGGLDCPPNGGPSSGGGSRLGIFGLRAGQGGGGGCGGFSGNGLPGYLQLDWWEETN